MTVDTTPIPFDPHALDDFYAAVSRVSGRDRSTRVAAIDQGVDAIGRIAEHADGFGAGRRVLIVQDDSPMRRDDHDLKAFTLGLLEAGGRQVEVLELSHEGGVHADEEFVRHVASAYRPGDVLVALGSGSITDITKHAAFGLEAGGAERIPLISVMTANSVSAYTSELAVISTDGVKRTRPSRLPDVVVQDLAVLRDAPESTTLGGVGDASVGWCSMAEYRLAYRCGLGSWEPLSVQVFLPGLTGFLGRDDGYRSGGLERARLMANALSAGGFAMTFAGESAPASGLEHVTSHMLDMRAGFDGREIGNHGEQCGVATLLVLLAYRHLVQHVDPESLRPRPLDLEAEKAKTLAAFSEVDPTGVMGAECWNDYEAKCAAWQQNTAAVDALLDDWQGFCEEIAPLLAEPEEFVRALEWAGHPLTFAQVDSRIDSEAQRWAFLNARLMRKRAYAADLLGFAGLWDEALVDVLFEQAAALVAAPARHASHGETTEDDA